MSKSRVARLRERKELPYGMWTTETGTEVLFNRSYTPIWARHLGVFKPVEFTEYKWIDNIKYQDFFFNDGTSPFRPFGHVKKVRDLVTNIRDLFVADEPIPMGDKIFKYGTRDARRAV